MIDFGICRHQCGRCVWHPVEESDSDSDSVGVRPSVRCDVSGDVLLMNSDAPEECPYKLEHKLFTQDVPTSFANYMSGCRRQSSEAKF